MDRCIKSTINEELETSYFGIELITAYNYLNNDWLFGYQFGNKINVSLSCGIFYSYYLNTSLNIRNYRYIDPKEANSLDDPAIPVGYSEDESSSRDRYEKVSDWDFGIVGGISLGYEFTDSFGLSISGKYHHDLQDIAEMRLTEEVNMYNRSIVTFIGIKFRI